MKIFGIEFGGKKSQPEPEKPKQEVEMPVAQPEPEKPETQNEQNPDQTA